MPAASEIAAFKQEVATRISDGTLTEEQLKAIVLSLQDCRFTPLLKLGMSQPNALEAIDGAFVQFIGCLRTKFQP